MRPFHERYRRAVDDPNVRSGLLAFQRGWKTSRDSQIAGLERMAGVGFDQIRRDFAAMKAGVFEEWESHLSRFTEAAARSGSEVVRVRSAEEACAHVAEIARRHRTLLVVKGKSMVTEEIGLNDHLEAAGITAVETDLGEWLLQVAGDHPSHLVMPAIHKRAAQIASLLEATLGRPFDPADIDAMVKVVRSELREQFLGAGMGISGANALIAESGTVMLVCNEGNNRMSVALPPVHVVVAGIEKLVPDMDSAMDQVRLLARSATGQPITTYTSFVTGPRPGQTQHIVLVDNGRTAMAADPDISAALSCIRCGACANVCPPYQVVGGHAFGHIYSGAIGLVNTAFHHGIEAAAGPQSLCVSCGACSSVCPTDIPLADQILEIRHRVNTEAGGSQRRRRRMRRILLKGFSRRWLLSVALMLGSALTLPWRSGHHTRIPRLLRSIPAVSRHTRWRTPPAIPMVSGRRQAARLDHPPPLPARPLQGRQVAVFAQCIADRLAPGIVTSTVRLLGAMGANVEVPLRQHCCGLPAFDTGEWDLARGMAAHTLGVLDGYDLVVTPSPSCLLMLTDHAERLFREDAEHFKRAQSLRGRLFDLVGLLEGPGRLPRGSFAEGDVAGVTVHRFCQATNKLGRSGNVERLLGELCELETLPLFEAEVCCGFGGYTSFSAPEVGAGILERKIGCLAGSGASISVTDNPGCVIHLRGGGEASGEDITTRHLAEFLAGRLPV